MEELISHIVIKICTLFDSDSLIVIFQYQIANSIDCLPLYIVNGVRLKQSDHNADNVATDKIDASFNIILIVLRNVNAFPLALSVVDEDLEL